ESDSPRHRVAHSPRPFPFHPSSLRPHPLREGEDFYREGAALVFTASYHLQRGYCCESGCRHCPYRKAANNMDDSENSCEATVEARHGE
ncbi:MAG: DUF5522 domain-containing protein, partial [Acidobacteriota bacterium]|nr:DUF5522 domain-containing protein [Acidobacteriota bacterium]